MSTIVRTKQITKSSVPSVSNSTKTSTTSTTKSSLKTIPNKLPTSNIMNSIVLKTAYLGNKGYTIAKSELTNKQLEYLKEILYFTPKVFSPTGVINEDEISFFIYRESTNRLYVPRYFGIKNFGMPSKNKICEGENINLTFNGTLRDYQVPVINKYLEHVKDGGSGLLELFCGWGKTDATIYTIGQLKKKTLIIVHKEFLLNQWTERILKYYPTARIGKIQAQTIDINDKDIVIALLQSLSMKEYDEHLFDSFGFTIIDEVHHISSKVFSNALFKIVTKYMLGLSATMNRKDGATEVFKMFLGDVVYKQERSKNEDLIVRGIFYKSKDSDFNETLTDFKGNVAVSKMISKLVSSNERSEFILKIIKDLIIEEPKRQIMLIAQYKGILNYMFSAINHGKIGDISVGYYVGGMKEKDLKESESKQIVLATYAMASEGLDIKTLSTLVMLTPMTNIEQSVGRILRQKHNHSAVVVDIIDPHTNFVNQWNRRKSFYKHQNYKIITTDRYKYSTDLTTWTSSLNKKSYNSPVLNNHDSSDDNDESDSSDCEENVKDSCLFDLDDD